MLTGRYKKKPTGCHTIKFENIWLVSLVFGELGARTHGWFQALVSVLNVTSPSSFSVDIDGQLTITNALYLSKIVKGVQADGRSVGIILVFEIFFCTFF